MKYDHHPHDQRPEQIKLTDEELRQAFNEQNRAYHENEMVLYLDEYYNSDAEIEAITNSDSFQILVDRYEHALEYNDEWCYSIRSVIKNAIALGTIPQPK